MRAPKPPMVPPIAAPIVAASDTLLSPVSGDGAGAVVMAGTTGEVGIGVVEVGVDGDGVVGGIEDADTVGVWVMTKVVTPAVAKGESLNAAI